jgi:hypothetical protein
MGDATPVAHGYAQTGEVDARIELTEGVLEIVGPATRVHVWGAPYLPVDYAMPSVDGSLRAPYRRTDGTLVDQVLGRDGWFGRRAAAR